MDGSEWKIPLKWMIWNDLEVPLSQEATISTTLKLKNRQTATATGTCQIKLGIEQVYRLDMISLGHTKMLGIDRYCGFMAQSKPSASQA